MTEVLIVDDESSICEMVDFALSKEGYEVRSAHDSDQALRIIGEKVPDIILVDWMMPGMNGVELIRCLRSEPTTQRLPVIMLTAKETEDNKVEGLNAGADDYIAKPFSNKELGARVKALLRRANPYQAHETIHSGHLTIEPQTHQLTVDGKSVLLSPIEFRLLYFLVLNEGKVFSRQQILDNVWGIDKFISERTVDVQIRRLRSSLAACGPHQIDRSIQTIRSVGYRYTQVQA